MTNLLAWGSLLMPFVSFGALGFLTWSALRFARRMELAIDNVRARVWTLEILVGLPDVSADEAKELAARIVGGVPAERAESRRREGGPPRS